VQEGAAEARTQGTGFRTSKTPGQLDQHNGCCCCVDREGCCVDSEICCVGEWGLREYLVSVRCRVNKLCLSGSQSWFEQIRPANC
jgi:hypothetical protein